MFTLTHHIPPVNTAGSSEAERRELAARYHRRVAIPLASTVLRGKKSIREEELLRPMRLLRKRRSVQLAAVAILIDSLRARGVIPANFVVLN